LRPRREVKASRRRQDRRSSTSQGKDSIEKTTRTVIDTVEEGDDRHLSCSHPSEATTHIASDCKAKNYDVQPLRKGSVDHKRLRSDDHRFPLCHWKVFTKASSSTFFFPFAGAAETGGACWTIFELKHYTRSTDDQRVIDVSPVSQEPGNPTPTILSRK